MSRKLITIGLLTCILLMAGKMLSYPVGITHMRVHETDIFLITDCHVPGDVASIDCRVAPLTNALTEWLKGQRSREGERILALLEEHSDHYGVRHSSDTLSSLCEVAKRSEGGNVEFKFADRRGRAIVTCQALFYMTLQSLVQRHTNGNAFLEDQEEFLISHPDRKEGFFASQFPILKRGFIKKIRALEQDRILFSIPSNEYITSLNAVIEEIDRSLPACNNAETDRLRQYRNKIGEAKVALERFFGKYDEVRCPYTKAFFNSMERTKSFKPFLDLYHNHIENTLVFDVADVGFYLDIISAIRSGTRRIVLYAGALHIVKVRKALMEDSGAQIVREVGITTLEAMERASNSKDFIANLNPARLQRMLNEE